MTKSECIIRSIIGAERASIRALALAIDIAADLLFTQGISMDEIAVSKDIYPAVAKQVGKSMSTTTRRIERTANLCIDALDDALTEEEEDVVTRSPRFEARFKIVELFEKIAEKIR